MSSLVIAGNTSGTVTLSAPAVAGTTTLTLPATSGTIIASSGGVASVSQGGTGNGSLATTAGGVVYTDGSVLQNVGAGTSGYYLKSNGASAPSWAAISSGGYTYLGGGSLSGSTVTLSALTLTNYKFLYIQMDNVVSTGGGGSAQIYSGSCVSVQPLSSSVSYKNYIMHDLINNMSFGWQYRAESSTSTYCGFYGNCGYTTATTSISIQVNAGTFTGTYRVWGIA